MSELVLGVDLGGTKIEAVLLRDRGDDAPEVLERSRVPTHQAEGYDAILARTAGLVRDVAKRAGLAELPAVGVGMPGSIHERSGRQLVKNSNTTCLNGRPFRADLAAELRTSVAFGNDANCFALAEARWGAGRGARVVFGVILGTGVGGGVVLTDGAGIPRAWDGAQGIAGEWGHVVLDPLGGPACYCGRRGCIETYLSGPAFESAYVARGGEALSLPEIARRARDGEARAADLLTERVDLFGRAMATVIDILDPDVVVLGGGASNLDVFTEHGPAAVARWVFDAPGSADDGALATRIVRNVLGDSAGVLGAALLASTATTAR